MDDMETGMPCALLLALGHAAPLGLGFMQVGVLATQMHVSDTDQRPVCLVYLLLYEAAQFLDEFGQMSQTPLHSLLQHVVYALARVIFCPLRAPCVQFVAFDAVRRMRPMRQLVIPDPRYRLALRARHGPHAW